MSAKWQFILSSDCPIYHIFVSKATHGWNIVSLGTGRPHAISTPEPGSLKCVTYLSCGGALPNVLSGLSDTRRDPTDTGKASGSERMRGHTRQGCSQRPRVRPSSGYEAAQAATRARQRRCAPAPPPLHRTAVAVAYGSAHGRPHHRWHRARHPRAPTAVAPTLPSATCRPGRPHRRRPRPPPDAAAFAGVGSRRPRRPRDQRPPLRHRRRPLPSRQPPPSATGTTAALTAAATTRRPPLPRRPRRRRPPPPVSAAVAPADSAGVAVVGRPSLACPCRLLPPPFPPPPSPPPPLSAAGAVSR